MVQTCQWILHTRVYAGIVQDGGGSTGMVVAVSFGGISSVDVELVKIDKAVQSWDDDEHEGALKLKEL